MPLIQGGLVVAIIACIAALGAYPADRRETLIALAVFGTALGVLRVLGGK